MIAAITGANGFIGRHLCAAFRRSGYEVRPIVRGDFAGGGLDDIVRGVDVLVHAAAATRAPTHAALRVANVELTRTITAAALRSAVGRLVYVSSQAVAGPARSLDRPVTEDDPASPVEEYGRTKLAGETVVRDSGLPFTIVRPSAVYGPGDRDFAALFRLARLGVAIHPGNRDQWISILHVDDCVDGIVRAAGRAEALGRTYFLANDDPVQWETLYRLARAALGKSLVASVEIPQSVVAVGAVLGDLFARLTGHAGLLTTEKVALSRDSFWVCANQRVRRELGFAPRVGLERGVALLMRRLL